MNQTIAHDFPCSHCGAKLQYDASSGTMQCKYCKVEQVVPQYGWDIPIEEGIKIAARGFGTPINQFDCQECGAVVNVARNEQTAKCAFCGSAKVLAREKSGNPIAPKAIVPFKIDKTSAGIRFNKWLNNLWFRPNDLKKMAKVQNMDGVYIPFWVFDSLVSSSWTAESGIHYTETEWIYDSQGRHISREIEKTRWKHSYGQRQDYYNGNLVCASKGIPNMVENLRTFKIEDLVDYRPGFLAGWKAESYAIDLLPAWVKAQEDIKRIQEIRCSNDVPGDEHRFLSVKNLFSNVSFKHVLLPIYVSTYRYHNKPYQFLVNGQTGEVVGKAPWSIPKIAIAIITILASVLALGSLQRENI